MRIPLFMLLACGILASCMVTLSCVADEPQEFPGDSPSCDTCGTVPLGDGDDGVPPGNGQGGDEQGDGDAGDAGEIVVLPEDEGVPGPVWAFPDPSCVVQGEPIWIHGTAEGNPPVVAVWIFGEGYFSYTTLEVTGKGTFDLEIPGEETATLSPGDYFVIAQHPMENGALDVSPDETMERVCSTSPEPGTVLFPLKGDGALAGQEAFEAVLGAIEDPAVDDVAFAFKFPVDTVEATGDEGGDSEAEPISEPIPLKQVNATPAANFTASPTTGPAPLEVTFTDTSAGVVHSRFWTFGDGTTAWSNGSATVTHVYALPGNYSVSLTVANDGGEDTLARDDLVRVAPSGPRPIPFFTANRTFGVAPLTVQFTDRSKRGPLAWHWDFGDGNTSSEKDPVHTYASPGTYTVTLTVWNSGGSATASLPVMVRAAPVFPVPTPTVTIPLLPTISPRPTLPPLPGQPPVAFFKANVTMGRAPLAVQFTDMSFNAPTAWAWDFGDGANSTERNPVHVYVLPGTYTVTLTVRNAAGEGSTQRPVFAR
ncbi:MAG: PKD domain-containing protein [Methanolinea sp.]|nr:PKD domain-containing protein [Methanolinea sp.]